LARRYYLDFNIKEDKFKGILTLKIERLFSNFILKDINGIFIKILVCQI